MEGLLDFIVRFIGVFLGMLLYDFLEGKIDSIKGTTKEKREEQKEAKR